MIFAWAIQIAFFILLVVVRIFAPASSHLEAVLYATLAIKGAIALLGIWFIFYGLIWGFYKESILLFLPIRGTPSGHVDGFSAWGAGIMWITLGLFSLNYVDVIPFNHEVWSGTLRRSRSAADEVVPVVSIAPDTRYALNVYKSIHGEQGGLLIMLTETPDRIACEAVAFRKGQLSPLGDDQWMHDASECLEETYNPNIKPYFDQQITKDSYVVFPDEGGLQTVIKFDDLPPDSREAAMIHLSVAFPLTQLGRQVKVVLSKAAEAAEAGDGSDYTDYATDGEQDF